MMKKKLLALLIAGTMLSTGLLTFAGCFGDGNTGTGDEEIEQPDKKPDNGNDEGGNEQEIPHTHTYDKQVTEDKYLKSAASLTEKALYYYSCECGEKGAEVFEFGEILQATEGLTYELNEDKSSYSVIGKGEATTNDIVIPAEHEGKPVTAIPDYAFNGEGDMEITSVYIPASITEIGETEYAGAAFAVCYNLTAITVDKNNTAYKSENNCLLSIDGKTLYKGCYNSTIPEGVTKICGMAFILTALTEIHLPSSVTEIGLYAFGYNSDVESITVDADNKTFKSQNNCILSKDGTSLYLGCKNSIIPDGVTKIEDNAFYGCSELTELTIPSGVKIIGYLAFPDTKLTELVLPEGVTQLIDMAICGIPLLEKLTLPSSLTEIGISSISNCPALTDIKYNGTKEQWSAIKKDSGWNDYTGDFIITCTDGKLDKNGNEIE